MTKEAKFLTVEDARMFIFQAKSIFPCATNEKNRWHNGKKIIHLTYWVGSDTVGGLKVILRGRSALLIDWDTNSEDQVLFECKTIKEMFRYLKKHYAKEPEYSKKIERMGNYLWGKQND